MTGNQTAGDIQIAPIQAGDAESFHACLDLVAREERYLAFTRAPALEQTRDFIEHNLLHKHIQLVARDGSRVIGWCDILPGWQSGLQHCGVLGVGLLPAYRGRGIGRRLLTQALHLARTQGLYRIELEARSDNHAALALYEKLGFSIEGRKRAGLYLGDAYHDTTQMGLLIPERSSASDAHC